MDQTMRMKEELRRSNFERLSIPIPPFFSSVCTIHRVYTLLHSLCRFVTFSILALNLVLLFHARNLYVSRFRMTSEIGSRKRAILRVANGITARAKKYCDKGYE